MFSRGVPVEVIASWCRVTPARVRRTEDKEIGHSPGWFDRYPMIYDQPDPDYRGRFSRPTREGLWWKHYNDVAAYVAG